MYLHYDTDSRVKTKIEIDVFSTSQEICQLTFLFADEIGSHNESKNN